MFSAQELVNEKKIPVNDYDFGIVRRWKNDFNNGLDLGAGLIDDYIYPIISTAYNALNGRTEANYQQNFLNQQMKFNQEEAEKNRQFQLHMSNTAYQRMAEDLRKAGFNPALAFSSGGASTPAGSLATSSLATAPNVTASSTARYNTNINSITSTFNNLVTNAFDMIKSMQKNNTDMAVAIAKIFGGSK